MATADDQRLLELAAEPAGELFPMLRRAAAFRPLLVLLAVLPGLYALTQRPLTETAAWWALASVELVAGQSSDLIRVDGDPAGVATPWRPPLSVWLTALAMRAIGPDQGIATVLVSYLATIALVVLAYHVFGRLGDARLGLWMAVAIAFHEPVLAQAQTPAPISLGVVLALGATWGFYAHLRSATAPVSIPLLLAGISLGLCLLAAGPLAVGAAGLLAACAFSIPSRRPAARVIPHPSVARRRSAWPPAIPLAVLLLTAFAVGGWWPLMAVWEADVPDWSIWLTLGRLEADPASAAANDSGRFWLQLYQIVHGTVGALGGLTFVGLWRAVHAAFGSQVDARKPVDGVAPAWLRVLVIWFAVALLALVVVVTVVPHSEQAIALWQGFLVVPVVGLAAYGADEIARRRVGIVAALAALLVSLAVALDVSAWRQLFGPPSDPGLLVIVLAGSAPLFIGLIWRLCRDSDDRQQTVLGLVIVAHLAANAALGFVSVRRQTEDDRALLAFRRELSLIGEDARSGPARTDQKVSTWTFISDVAPPLTVRFVLQSQWQQATPWPIESGGVVETWDRALSGALNEGPSPERAYVVIEWSSRDTQPTNIQVPGLQIVPFGQPQFYRDRQLRAFLVTASASGG